jgi:hypothetical protein
VLTSNLPIKAFEELVGTAIFDRIRHACFALMTFGFPSKRSAMNEEYLRQCGQ